MVGLPLRATAAKSATFTRWNVYAETQRQLHSVRFATSADRKLVGDRVTDSVLGLAVLLTPPDLTLIPPELRLDGGSRPRHADSQK